MITTIWDSLTSWKLQNSPYQNPQNNTPPAQMTITAAGAEAGVLLTQVDLGDIQNVGDYAQVELEFTSANAPVAAPPANSTITVWTAFSSSGSKQPVELSTNAGSTVCAIPSVQGRTSVFMPPLAYMGGRYLYIWFDHTAFGAAVPINIRLRVNCQRA